jgi:hypothetical protein
MGTIMTILLEIRQLLEHLVASVDSLCKKEGIGIQQPQTTRQTITFDIAKGKISMVAMMVWAMIDMGWIIAKDENGKIIKDLPSRRDAANWMGQNLFGKPFKKWDQLIEYIFRYRNNRNKEDFLKIFDRLKNIVGRNIKTD